MATMKINFVDLARQNKIHNKEFLSVINKVIRNADFIEGNAVKKFEENFAKYCGKKYCIGLNSGTDALFFALLAYGIGPGDEVITAPNSYFSTAMVIEQTGAKSVFVDINPTTHTIDPDKISNKINSRTKAIIPIHIFGQPAEMDSIIALANKHGLKIIEDCCQAHGAKYNGKTLPYTETGAFSFYPGKNLGSFGDAGALVTNNRQVANKVRLLHNDGSTVKYTHQLFGYKSRLDTLQAAILNIKLKYLNKWNKQRIKHAQLYTKLLNKSVREVSTPNQTNNVQHVCHLYVIETIRRDELKKYLSLHGINTVIHYPIPIHLQKPYRKLGYKLGDFPVTENKSRQILSLPMFPELSVAEIEYIVRKIDEFFRGNRI